jgi:NAD-dependent SIR2 family protein deacetylase
MASLKCWNCEEDIDEEERIRKIEGERVCQECYEDWRDEQRQEADYPDTVRERHELFGGN